MDFHASNVGLPEGEAYQPKSPGSTSGPVETGNSFPTKHSVEVREILGWSKNHIAFISVRGVAT